MTFLPCRNHPSRCRRACTWWWWEAGVQRLLQGGCDHNIWYTGSNCRQCAGWCLCVWPPGSAVRAQLVGVHRIGRTEENSWVDSWQLSRTATSCHPTISIIHTCIQYSEAGGHTSPWECNEDFKSIVWRRSPFDSGVVSGVWCDNNLDKTLGRDTACLTALSARACSLACKNIRGWDSVCCMQSLPVTLILQQLTEARTESYSRNASVFFQHKRDTN